MSGEDFLSRWSRRKHAANRGEALPTPSPAAAPSPVPPPPPASATQNPDEGQAPLQPVESLTPESDFAPFMRSDVDPGTRREALKTLFRDERFNVMDGLDVYIDDYSKPDPIPADWLGKLNQMARLGEYREPPPKKDPAASGGIPEQIGMTDQAVAPAEDPPMADARPTEPAPPELKHS